MAPATFTLHATYHKPDGTPQVQTRPVHIYVTGTKVVKDTAGNVIISGRVEANVVDGVLNVPGLPDPRDTTLNPTGFGYTVTAAFRDNRPAAVSFGGAALDAYLSGGVLELAKVTTPDPSTFSPTATYVETTDLAPVATTGAYADLTGQPAIPSTAADVGADPAGSASTAETNAKTYADQKDAAEVTRADAAYAPITGGTGYDTIEALRARMSRTNPPRWQQATDGLGSLISTGLTTSGNYIAATTGGTAGDAIYPVWGSRKDMRASFKVKATKTTTGSKSGVGFVNSPIGSLPTGTSPTSAGAYLVGYLQGTGIAVIRDNIGSASAIVADANLTDGADYTVQVQVESTISLSQGQASGTIAARVLDSTGAELAMYYTNFTHQYYSVKNALLRTNVAAGALSEVKIAIHPLGDQTNRSALLAGTVGTDDAFFHFPAVPNGKVVYAFHGRGGTAYETGWQSTSYRPTFTKLADAGYLVVVPKMGGDLWGNDTALGIVSDLHDLIVSSLDVERDGVYVWGNSMGCTAACNVITRDVLPVKAAYLAQPAVNLDTLASLFPELVSGPAYSDLPTRDAHNPLKQAGTLYAGTPLMIVASPSDTTAVKTENADQLATLASPNTLVRQITASGNHQDVSHYRPDDTLRWFRSFG